MTGTVIKARNVIFEEGLSHHTLQQPLADFFSEPTQDTPTLSSSNLHHVSHSGLPITPQVHSTDPLLHPSHLAELTTLLVTPTVPHVLTTTTPVLLPTQTSILCHSLQTIIPTAASRAAEETLNIECLVCEGGEDWATDNSTLHAFVADSDLHVPLHYAEAIRYLDLWEGPMQDELENLRSHGIFCVVKKSFLPAGKKIIGCCWVFTNKYNADGNVIKWKARLITKGFSQVQEEDFNERYAVVAHLESFCITMAVAAQKWLKIWQVNFISAYLNSDCQYNVYMELPPGFVLQEEDDKYGVALQVERSEGKQGDDEEYILVEGGELGDDEECVLLLLKTVYRMMQGVYDWFYLLDDIFAVLRYY